MPVLLIDEEYGYQYWIANLTDDQWARLVATWQTVRGMSCLVPIRFIVPQARLLEWNRAEPVEEYYKEFHKEIGRATNLAHFHERDDSHLDGVRCADWDSDSSTDVPFEMNGISYSPEDVRAIMQQYRCQEQAERTE